MKPLAVLLALSLASAAGAALGCEPRLHGLGLVQVKLPHAAPATPATPAPPLPFRYIGRIVQDGRAEVLLLRGAQHFAVSAGDSIGAQYRVERVSESEIVFTYLPLNIEQSLPL
jgi:hypothetical protein